MFPHHPRPPPGRTNSVGRRLQVVALANHRRMGAVRGAFLGAGLQLRQLITNCETIYCADLAIFLNFAALRFCVKNSLLQSLHLWLMMNSTEHIALGQSPLWLGFTMFTERVLSQSPLWLDTMTSWDCKLR